MRLYDNDGRRTRELTGHPSTIADVAWRPDRNELIVARYGGIHIWDPSLEQPIQTLNYRGSVLRIAVSPTGKFVATADQNSTVHFWRTDEWKDAQMSGYPHLVTSLSWESTGRYLVTDGGEDGCVWDCSDPGPTGTTPVILKGDPDFLTRCVAFAPEGTVCATAGESGVVALTDVTNPDRVEVDRIGDSVSALIWVTGKPALIVGTISGVVTAYG